MKKALKILKWVGIVVGSLAVVFVVLVFAMKNKTFDAPYPNIHASTDSSVIARGKYLVTGPAHCAFCHAPANLSDKVERGEVVDLIGGFEFKLPIGIIRSANITSDPETGIGKFTDGEIARTLRHAVGKDGRAIPDFMPFQNLSDDDLTAILSYLRTLPPVKHYVEHYDFNFLGMAVKAFLLKPLGPNGPNPKTVTPDSTVEYGKYIVWSVANCRGCHTERDMKTGAFIGEDFAGGSEFEGIKDPKFKVYPPNITSDQQTGKLANWTEEFFVERFRKGKLVLESPMPWGPFSRMTDLELKAVYRYLKTVKPVHHIAGVEEKKASM